ncbi:hypothetical protein ACLKMY_05190 [Paraburkholderia mimosarum]|uniref:hypothetical protein n=1 Tax=Paraburkholderia mimosarum TaxID=312026 RepID=UPI0039C2C239
MSDIQSCAEAIARTGSGIIPMTMAMMESYASLIDGFPAIPEETKRSYRFDDETDGFLPFGSEYAHADTKPVRLLENELAVLSGSLLTQLSDCAIPATYHAVLNPDRPRQRSSLIYFANPDGAEELIGFCRKKRVDLSRSMNVHHTRFGNRPIAPRTYPALPGVQ